MQKPTHIITTDVYYIEDTGEAVPEYEMDSYGDETLSGFLYIESGTEGYFDGEKFETIEGSDTRLSRYYAKTI